MKNSYRFIAIALLCISAFTLLSLKNPAFDAKDFVGAWGYGDPQNKTVMIASDNVFSVAKYDVIWMVEINGGELEFNPVHSTTFKADRLCIEFRSCNPLSVNTDSLQVHK